MVDDDAGDVAYTREVFAEHRVRNRLTVLADGRQAVAYLRRQHPYPDAGRPDIVLLDLNLPAVDGWAVIDVMRAEPRLRDVPLVVLTTSSGEEQMLRARGVRAEYFVRKPVDFERLVEVVQHVETLYLQVERASGTPEPG